MTGGNLPTSAVVARYDQVIFDLDGVLILGNQPISGAAAAVREVRAAGVGVAFATNNASRSPGQVAELLTGLGIPAQGSEVLTSGRAAAAVLAMRYPRASPVLVIGTESLVEEVRLAGLLPVQSAEDKPVAVIQGYGPDVGWGVLAEASLALMAGAGWVATNTDRTLPSPRGPLPGNGALVAALVTALDRQPDVTVGKPEPELFVQAAKAAGARRPLVVGDRLDTDVQGANRAGLDSLLVLTGVCRPADLLAAPRNQRPTYLALDLTGLVGGSAVGGSAVGGSAVAGGGPGDPAGGEEWRVLGVDGTLILDGSGSLLGALWALCQVQWAGDPNLLAPGAGQAAVLPIVGATPAARDALRQLELG